MNRVREWKPGDVARVNGSIAVRTDDNMSWWTTSGRLSDPNVAYARPLVVIDLGMDPLSTDGPGRSEARLLVDMLRESADNFFALDAAALARKVAGQIEDHLPPPKPEEPTDPAVRVFAAGTNWAKVGLWWVSPATDEGPREWDYLADQHDLEISGERSGPRV